MCPTVGRSETGIRIFKNSPVSPMEERNVMGGYEMRQNIYTGESLRWIEHSELMDVSTLREKNKFSHKYQSILYDTGLNLNL